MAEPAQGCGPRLTRVAVLFHPEATWAPFVVRTAQEAGERLSLKVTAAIVPEVAAIEPAIAAMSGDGGLAVLPDGFNIENRATTIALAAKHRVPAIYGGRYNVVDGGLMSYARNLGYISRRSDLCRPNPTWRQTRRTAGAVRD